MKKDQFRPRKNDEEVLGPEVSCLSAFEALIYLVDCTRPDITFATNLLARFSSSPTWGHWNRINHVFHYLRRTINLSLFYLDGSKYRMIDYTDESCL